MASPPNTLSLTSQSVGERSAAPEQSASRPSLTTLPIALTVQEVSEQLQLDPRTIRAMLRSGELEGNQRGHAIRVSRASVLEWLSGKRRAPRSRRNR